VKTTRSDKTVEMVPTKEELQEVRRSLQVCSHCGVVFSREHEDAKVCENCVKEAMEEQSFTY
jgi:ribosomal protein S27AE